MKLTIRSKLFLMTLGLVSFFVMSAWAMNRFFLDDFYLAMKKNVMKEQIEALANTDPLKTEEWSAKVDELERKYNLTVALRSSQLDVKYSTAMGRGGIQRSGTTQDQNTATVPQATFPAQGIRNRNILQAMDPESERVVHDAVQAYRDKDGVVFLRAYDMRLRTTFLMALLKKSNGDYLQLSSVLAPMQESARLASSFFLITGIVTLLLGAVVVYLVSKRFTQPIAQLNQIARSMADLDFSQKATPTSKDEIGELGHSINSMSAQLETAVGDLRSANDKLREDIEHERRIDAMRKEFIASASHELKTPLAIIQGYAEGLRDGIHQDEAGRSEYCDVILDESHKMNHIVRQMLDLSQMEAGHANLEPEVFEIPALLRQAMRRYKIKALEQGVVLSEHFREGLLGYGDVTRMDQVIDNYLSNAMHHVDGTKEIEVAATEEGPVICVSVRNTGTQIPEEKIPELWNSFYKVDKARTRAYGGTGLGLSIVRAIQEAHQSGYGVENTGDGVRFWFEIKKGTEGEP